LAGKLEDINPFTINGVRYAIIICFELRFKELWRRIEGVDIVVIPWPWWGKNPSPRTILGGHFFQKALGIY